MKLFEIPIYYRAKDKAMKEKYWRSYEYNEIIGWVVLETRPNAIRAEYFLVRERPSKVLIRKEFEPKGKLFQLPLARSNDKDIYKRILNSLTEWQGCSHLAKYCFDIEAFKAIGPFVPWRSVCNVSAHNNRFKPTFGSLRALSGAQPERYAA